MPQPPPLILCFGDSLTAGFQAPSPGYPLGCETPYGDTLQACLGLHATVVTSGICGELTGEMVLRLRTDVLDRRPRVVIILGGTNDLGCYARPSDIMRNLVTMYERTTAAGIIPVPVTVPSIRLALEGAPPDAAAWMADHLERRRQLNRLILEYADTKRVPYLDLFQITADPATHMLAVPYSNDGLHLSTEGYRHFGTQLYAQVFEPHRQTLLGAPPA